MFPDLNQKMIKEKSVAILCFLELLSRCAIIKCFTTTHNGGKENQGCWNEAVLHEKVHPYQARHRSERTVEGSRDHGTGADLAW